MIAKFGDKYNKFIKFKVYEFFIETKHILEDIKLLELSIQKDIKSGEAGLIIKKIVF